MYELLKKGKNEEHTTNTKSSKRTIKNTFNRSNSMWNTDSGANIYDRKGHKVIQMKLYNSMKRGAPVDNVEDLNEYIRDVLCGTLIVTYDMFDARPEVVDEAIQELDYNIFEEDIVTTIQGKIEELASRRETEKRTEEENEEQRIWELSAALKTMFRESAEKGQKGRFVGDSSKWHIHMGIKKVHLKYGIDSGSRCDIDCNNPESIKSAVIALNYTGEEDDDKKQCYCWLRYTMIECCGRDLPKEYRVDM